METWGHFQNLCYSHQNYLEDHQTELAFDRMEEEDYIDRDEFLGEVKTAMVLEGWINEKTENEILEQYGVQPGDRFAAVQKSEWLLYSAYELSQIVGASEHRRHLRELQDRIRHGVTKKLLPLVRLKGIGRVRAKVLYNNGFTGISELKRAPLEKLISIPLIGPRVAKNIKEEVGGLVDEEEWKKLSKIETEQRSLKDFVEEKKLDEKQ